jgi:hypothetical protein
MAELNNQDPKPLSDDELEDDEISLPEEVHLLVKEAIDDLKQGSK